MQQLIESILSLFNFKYRVLVFRDAPELIYTGLTKIIGKPRELEKNNEDPDYYKTAIDINIPIA